LQVVVLAHDKISRMSSSLNPTRSASLANASSANVSSNRALIPANVDAELQSAMIADRHALRRKLQEIKSLQKNVDAKLQAAAQRLMNELVQKLHQSQKKFALRLAQLPKPEYPTELPVSAKKDEIAAAIQKHQVVIVCGETGSGKTTQLPKICLELGRGVAGLIGHTQPRRIAARSVASRIAQELKTTLGEAVG